MSDVERIKISKERRPLNRVLDSQLQIRIKLQKNLKQQ